MPRKRKPTVEHPPLPMGVDAVVICQSATDIDSVKLRCPHCGAESDYADCDVLGADDDSCFCPSCTGTSSTELTAAA